MKIRIKSILGIIAAFMLVSVLPCFAGDVVIRVSVLMNQYAMRVQGKGNLEIKDAYTLKKIGSFPGDVTIKIVKGKIFANKTETNSKFIYVVAEKLNSVTTLNGTGYRGYYLIGFNDQGRLQAINYVDLDDYISGVLGGEISAAWPLESIKAQAVAARTYVMYKLQQGRSGLYDVVNDTGDQMYIGVRGESPVFTRAVNETRAQVLARDNKIICAYYHSSCGGGTADSANVFQGSTAGLSGVKCPFCSGAPNSNWGKSLDAEIIRLRLARNGIKTGKIFSIKPYSRDKYNRVIYLEVKHEGGVSYILSSEFRKSIGYREIKSTKFDIKPQGIIPGKYSRSIASNRSRIPYLSNTGGSSFNDMSAMSNIPSATAMTNGIPSAYYFTGSGWGHGVGLCQWGSKGMGAAGYTYKQILATYYPGMILCEIESND
ncbi:MAG: SpoIID/LytB domain-containing protein [Firmicutes bacterium]|nr:SpoIID/LytB domain-containing protein [Bacillota bacterium]